VFIRKIVIFAFFIAMATCMLPVHALNLSFFGSSVAQQYNQMLAKEDEEIRQEFFALNGVTIGKEEWNTLKEQHVAELHDLIVNNIKYSEKPLSEAIQRLVQSMLKSQGMHNVTILRATQDDSGIAAYGRNYIVICVQYINSMCTSHTQTQAVLLHEIMHIKNDDELEKYCQAKLAQNNPHITTDEQANEFDKKFIELMKKRHYLNEKRADIQAGLVGINYARAFKAFLEKLYKNNPLFAGDETHPSHQVRIAYMTELINAIDQEEKASMLGRIKALFNLRAPILQTH
jgi:hypothetical protein